METMDEIKSYVGPSGQQTKDEETESEDDAEFDEIESKWDKKDNSNGRTFHSEDKANSKYDPAILIDMCKVYKFLIRRTC